MLQTGSMTEEQAKTLLTVVLLVGVLVLWVRYLRRLYGPTGRMDSVAFQKARSAGVMPILVTCLGVVAVAVITFSIPVLFSWAPWIVGAAALIGAMWTVVRMTRALELHAVGVASDEAAPPLLPGEPGPRDGDEPQRSSQQ
jgi:hypothetical protein